MEELYYMIYIIVFVIGSIAGLLLSYKKHMEPFIISEIDVLTLVSAIIGLAIGRRPGYGRKETAIGILIAVVVWICTSGVI